MKAMWPACLCLFTLLNGGCNQQPAPSIAKNQTPTNVPISFIPDSSPGVTNGMTVKEIKEIEAMAEKGDALAQCAIAECYANGIIVERDYVQAVKWFRKAAEAGIAEAECNLASCYYNGQGIDTNKVEAGKWLRKAAEHNFKEAQFDLGSEYFKGGDVFPKDLHEASTWYQKAAEQGYSPAQFCLGQMYLLGQGVKTNCDEAIKWFRMAAEQGDIRAQRNLAAIYLRGEGVPKDFEESFKWIFRAADTGDADSQYVVGFLYLIGCGITQDNIQAYKWFNLSAAKGNQLAKTQLQALEQQMSFDQIAKAQKLTREYKPGMSAKIGNPPPRATQQDPKLIGNGSGFFITHDGYLISNAHVVEGATQVRLVTNAGLISAKVVRVDSANDLALLKTEGKFSPLPIAASRGVKLGSTVATVGFPNIGLQGFSPKLAKGEIASLSGAGDDARYFQISVPVQPGNSGGALVDEQGNVVGVVSAKLSARAALAASGALPENVNYAVKSGYLLTFLESVPEVSAKLKEPETTERKFEDVVKSAEQAAVLVLVY